MGRPDRETVVREWDTREREGVKVFQGWELENVRKVSMGLNAKGPACKPTLWRMSRNLRGTYDEVESCFCRIIRRVRSRRDEGLREKSWHEAHSLSGDWD